MTIVPVRQIAVLGALVALGSAIAASPASATVTSRPAIQAHKALGCSLVSAAEINKLIHVVVDKAASNVTENVTTCEYNNGASKVSIQFFQPWSSSQFTAWVSNETKYGEKATALSGYGSKADVMSIAGLTGSMVVLKGSVGLIVGVSSTALSKTLANEETLAKYVLPSL
jgi:hypothetical protein